VRACVRAFLRACAYLPRRVYYVICRCQVFKCSGIAQLWWPFYSKLINGIAIIFQTELQICSLVESLLLT